MPNEGNNKTSQDLEKLVLGFYEQQRQFHSNLADKSGNELSLWDRYYNAEHCNLSPAQKEKELGKITQEWNELKTEHLALIDKALKQAYDLKPDADDNRAKLLRCYFISDLEGLQHELKDKEFNTIPLGCNVEGGFAVGDKYYVNREVGMLVLSGYKAEDVTGEIKYIKSLSDNEAAQKLNEHCTIEAMRDIKDCGSKHTYSAEFLAREDEIARC